MHRFFFVVDTISHTPYSFYCTELISYLNELTINILRHQVLVTIVKNRSPKVGGQKYVFIENC